MTDEEKEQYLLAKQKELLIYAIMGKSFMSRKHKLGDKARKRSLMAKELDELTDIYEAYNN